MLDADIVLFLRFGMVWRVAKLHHLLAALGVVLLLPFAAQADDRPDDRRFRLAVPDVLAESGLLDYLLPRFSLKTGLRIEIVPEGRGGIGSTPSFPVLRTLSDWEAQFQTFYALKPHPAFTQITGVTAPFAAHLPPAIVPIEVTPHEIEAILAYVGGLAPADLGAPIQVQ